MNSDAAFLGAMSMLLIVTLIISLFGLKKKIGFLTPWLSGFGGGLLIGYVFGETIGFFIGIIITIILVSTSSSKNKSKDLKKSSPSIADELSKLNDLKEQGVLSEEEFDTQKQRLLRNK